MTCGCREAFCPHGPSFRNDKKQGLYAKFLVERLDGSSEPGGKHAECDYFVLDWKHDRHAIAAARAYATSCETEFPALARDLRERADKEERDRASSR